MFGMVTANQKALSKQQQLRYGAVYCGICHRIREQASQTARLALSYDMVFLAMLLMSLYEPEETQQDNRCLLHPFSKRSSLDCEYIRYAADMNVALAYYKAQDDVDDEGSLSARFLRRRLQPFMASIRTDYPGQCQAIEQCLQQLQQLQQENCPNPDLPAGCFGKLLSRLFVYREDMWTPALSKMADALGRFIYLADAAVDYARDVKKGSYNPFAAMGTGENPELWASWLEMAMGRCVRYYETLPLVQDKPLLDHILYSGVWMEFKRCCKCTGEDKHDPGSL